MDAVTQLRGAITGRTIAPGDAEYDQMRTVFYGGIDSRPALIVRAANTDDVVQSITLARESGLELAIRSGGHSVAGHSTVEGGIVLDLRDLKSLDIAADGTSVWAGSGLTAREFSEAVAPHGLALGFGDTGSVGIGGLTLGGGVGYFVRKYG
ncbi:MAG: FAD-binding oxidoreductase, partial [bacterium]